jgi:hypothetical protein
MNVIKDPVDELLKADASLHRDRYLDDHGFTLRVLDHLPAGSRASDATRYAILFGSTLLAAVFAAVFAGGGNFLVDAVMDIATSSLSKSALAFVAIVGIMIAVSVAAATDN